MSESIRHRGSTIENYSPWLHRAAVLYVILTFIVIISGGNVTSRGAGMSVPDGFTVYGYFLWAFPIDRWVGNIFHEHVHRLVGSVIGITALAVAVWTAIVERRRTVRMIAFVAALMVLVQGILGALRVNQISTTLAVVHGVHAQMILCMTVWLAAATSRAWIERRSPNPGARRPHALCAALLFVMFIQLALGAVVRHTGAGLAIPDFPASYGGLVPPMTEQGIIDAADAMDLDPDVHPEYALPWQVGVHFAHRLWAIAVVVTAGIAIASIAKGGADSWLRRPALAIAAMLVVQVALGAFTVLSDRHTEVATAHQAMGAALIATTMLLLVRAMLSNGAALASQESEARPADDLTSRTTITANP